MDRGSGKYRPGSDDRDTATRQACIVHSTFRPVTCHLSTSISPSSCRVVTLQLQRLRCIMPVRWPALWPALWPVSNSTIAIGSGDRQPDEIPTTLMNVLAVRQVKNLTNTTTTMMRKTQGEQRIHHLSPTELMTARCSYQVRTLDALWPMVSRPQSVRRL